MVQLSTIHYFLAIAFCALAVIAYAAALRRPSIELDVISILCYFLAMLAKEVAIPLPLLLIALPLRDARTRIRFAIGHGLAAIAYFLWRHAILGTFLGDYGWQIDPAEWPRLLVLPSTKDGWNRRTDDDRVAATQGAGHARLLVRPGT